MGKGLGTLAALRLKAWALWFRQLGSHVASKTWLLIRSTSLSISRLVSPPVVVAGAAITVCGVLLLVLASVPLGRTPVWIDVQTTFVSFQLNKPSPIWDPEPVHRAVIDGMTEISFGRGTQNPQQVKSRNGLQLRVTKGRDADEKCPVNQSETASAPYVGIRSASGVISMTFISPTEVVVNATDAKLLVAVTGRGVLTLAWDDGCHVVAEKQSVDVRVAGQGDMQIALWRERSTSSRIIQAATEISDLRFVEVDVTEGSAATMRRPKSGILSGTVTFEAFADRRLQLRPDTPLYMSLDNASLASVSLTKEGIRVRAFGEATMLRTGYGDYAVNRLPSQLEWLRGRHGIWLAWATLVIVIATIAAALTAMAKIRAWIDGEDANHHQEQRRGSPKETNQ